MLTDAPAAVGASYNLYGLSLTVSALGRPDLMAAIDARLKPFPAGPLDQADLHFDFSSSATHLDRRPERGLRSIYEPERGEVLYDDAVDRLHLAFDRIRKANLVVIPPLTRH